MIGIDMTTGSIIKKIFRVSLPIVVTNLINMAYNLTDMFWLGQVNQNALSAVGTIGLFMWLAQSFSMLARTSTEIKISQLYGEKAFSKVNQYSSNGLVLGMTVATIYALMIYLFKNEIIAYFNFSSYELVKMSLDYLEIANLAMFILIISQVFIAIYNGIGNTKIVFYISAMGLALNMILDPILILHWDLGTKGAAIATLIASATSLLLFVMHSRYKTTLLKNFRRNFSLHKLKILIKLGVFPMLTNVIFTFISIIVSEFIIQFGDANIAVNRIGTQVEALTWIIGGAAATAITVFVGQNIGAKKYLRSARGYTIVLAIMVSYSLLISLFFIYFGEELYLFFLPNESETAKLGATYLYIVAFSQAFMMLDLVTSGMFNGRSMTVLPSVITIIANITRIPIMYYLASLYGINGVWLTISLTAIFKGLVMLIAHCLSIYKSKEFKLRYFFS